MWNFSVWQFSKKKIPSTAASEPMWALTGIASDPF